MLERHEIKVSVEAGHSRAGVAKLAGVEEADTEGPPSELSR